MLIQFNTDDNVHGSQELAERVEGELRDALERFADRITRVEVHVSDENSSKGGENDKRCLIEARIAGQRPISVTDAAATVAQAIEGATDKLERALDHTLGKLDGPRHIDRPAASDETS
jgi:ribosome-associated translation inhibitor RaiA